MSIKCQKNPFPLRMADDIEEWVKCQAKAGERSANWLINQCLRAAKKAQEASNVQPA